MPTLTENVRKPGDLTPPVVDVLLELWGDGAAIHAMDPVAAVTVAGRTRAAATAGVWSIPNVKGNAAITEPPGTVYKVTRVLPNATTLVDFIDMPTTGGPYTIDQILVDPPAALTPSALSAHAADTALHGGGQELALANVTANFATASTTFVDVPGASITFIAPARPFVVTFGVPSNVEEAGQGAEMRIVGGATPTQVDWDFTPRATVAGQVFKQFLSARVPAPTFTPTQGLSVTFKGQIRTIVATSDASIVVDFAGPFQLSQLHAVTC